MTMCNIYCNSVRMSQLEAKSDVVETMTNCARSEGDGIPGLKSHVESPRTQRLNVSLILRAAIVIVTCVVIGLGYLFTVDVEPGLVVFSIIFYRLDAEGDGPNPGESLVHKEDPSVDVHTSRDVEVGASTYTIIGEAVVGDHTVGIMPAILPGTLEGKWWVSDLVHHPRQ